ncbi:hypothetical protein niasHS_003339 [Heterodera schachtii]|uniref:Uncharacterized protein n=1 Tax=Heterodera schachtii TaxID=97005 RepID=A0ABD2KG82_HETSC
MNEDDDELTREILALFDYEDKWDNTKGAQNRTIDTQRGEQSNGTNVNWATKKLETEQLQFSMDPLAETNSTNEWTTKSGEKTGEIQMEKGPAKEQQQLAEYDQLASNDPTKVDTITKTTPEQAEMTMATKNASETTAYSQRNHSTAEADLEREVNGTEMAQRKWEKVANDGERKGNSSEGEEKVPKMEENRHKKEMPTEENGHKKEMPTEETEIKANRTENVGSVLPISPFSSAPTVPSPQIDMPSVGILEEALSNGTASPSTIAYSENKLNESTEPSIEFTNITMPLAGTEMAPTNLKSIEKENENETEILAKNQSENAKSNLTTNTSQSTTELRILYPLDSELSLPLLSPMPPTELPMINYEANGTDAFVEEMSNRTEEGNGTSAGEGIKGGALEELKRKVEGKMRIDDAEFVELSEYRQHLRQILSDVESVLSKWPGQLAHFSDFPKSRRFISISASMPNRNSDLFIARKNAISASVSSNFEEIRKSPVKMGTTEAITAQMEMEKMPILTTTEKAKKEKTDREKETDGKETVGQKTKTIEEETNTEEIVGKKRGNTVEEKKETEEETTEKERMAKETKTGETEARETMAKETKIGETVARETEARKTTETRETETRKTVEKGTETRETETRKTMAKGTETSHPSDSLEPIAGPLSSESDSDERPHSNSPKKTGFFRAEHFSSKYFSLIPLRNISAVDHCKHLAQDDLVHELKQKGTYNPELMAWDVSGVFRFLDKTITDQYERQSKAPKSSDQAVKRNVEALERLLSELNLRCDVRSPEVLSRLSNLTMNESKRSIISPSLRQQKDQFQLMRHKRNSVLAHLVGKKRRKRRATKKEDKTEQKGGRKQQRKQKQKQKMIGDVHAVPFGCDKRGDSEDGYLRLCGACQTIRKLPDEFFPPFINEVACDEDKACLYFYDYPHGKCKQKHMNFVVLKNVGTPLCQIWEKFNLNVRVSCECFVDEMSFFSKYV